VKIFIILTSLLVVAGGFLLFVKKNTEKYLQDSTISPSIQPINPYPQEETTDKSVDIKASFTDLFFICLIFILLYIKNRNIRWFDKPSKLDYFIIIISGLIISYIIEHQALLQNKWSYTPLMPLILGVGLTPLIQLSTIAIFSIWFIKG